MPESSSGLRWARLWNTKASISMPPPAIIQAMMAPKPPLARPKVAGREKIPAPTIDPTTSAVRAATLSFPSAGVLIPPSLARGESG